MAESAANLTTILLRLLVCYFLFISPMPSQGQSLDHPLIWVTDQERPQILEKIKKYSWARDIVKRMRDHVDSAKDRHVDSPQTILKSIPPLGGQMKQHNKILTLASESGMLYFLSRDSSYAQLSADIIAAYSAVLAKANPKTAEIMGDEFFDARTTYNQFALAYDFVFDFLESPDTRVYDALKNKRVRFNNEAAQKALWNVAGNILQEYGKPDKHGRLVSNHPVLTAPGALFPILCIQDNAERKRLLKVFWDKGTHHQASFKNTLLPLYSSQGIWPESYSYSFMPNMLMVLNIFDRLDPQMNAAKKAEKIFEGTFILANLDHPDGRSIRYGDSKRRRNSAATNLRHIMYMADRNGLDQWKRRSAVALKKMYDDTGGYKPSMQNSVFGSYKPLQLFWGIDIPDAIKGELDFKPTVVVEHAGVALQRNFVEDDNEVYGLNGCIGGAHYVHSHCTGIAMELYGAGYVMAPNGGLPPSTSERSDPVHSDYFRLYAGNNTVISNGTSHGRKEGSWKGKANVWQNTAVNIASEPEHFADPVSENFSFATQFLRDEVNLVRQQRTLSTIRTSNTTGYYFDSFRVLSKNNKQFHDYVYHNIGDRTLLAGQDNRPLDVTPTKRYDNDIGDVVHSPGWRFFENEKASEPIDDLVKIRFDVDYGERFMHMFVPGGVEREFTTAVGPPTREAINGYDEKPTQILAIRKLGEAWRQPFIAIFEPSTQPISSVDQVYPLADRNNVAGAVVVSYVGGKRITDFVLSQDANNARYKNASLGIEFEGRFAVIRVEDSARKHPRGKEFQPPIASDSNTTFYMGKGTMLSWQGIKMKSKTRTSRSAVAKVVDGKAISMVPESEVVVTGLRKSSKTVRSSSGSRKSKSRSKPKDSLLLTASRRWTDKSGKFSVTAKLMAVKNDQVAIKKDDGSTIVIPLEKLADEDQRFVSQAIEADRSLLREE